MLHSTGHKYEVFICNISDGIMAQLIGTRIYHWMNNPDLNKEMMEKGFSITTNGTFDNNFMYLTSEKTLIDHQSAKTVEVLVKTYFSILLPFMPTVQILFKEVAFEERKEKGVRTYPRKTHGQA